MRRIFVPFFLLVFSLPVCLAQNRSQIKSPENSDPRNREDRRVALCSSLLYRIDAAVGLMDEPALRSLTRLRVATYLWSKKSASDRLKAIAEKEAEDAFFDIAAHKEQIPTGTALWLRKELLTQVQLHAPALAAKLKKKYTGADQDGAGFEKAYSLLNSRDGSAAAVASLRELISHGGELGPNLVFFLDRLEQQRSSVLFPLLSDILVAEEARTGTLSLTTLEYISRFYLQNDAPDGLKLRFLAVVVNATRDAYAFRDAGDLRQARNFLSNIAPSIERLSAALYAQAMAQLSVISSRIPPDNVSMQTIAERVKRSPDQLDAWIAEADSPENKFFRNDILTEAAQLALEKRKFDLAIEIVSKIEIKDEDKNIRLWRAQFLEDVSDNALEYGKPDIARRAVERIEDALTRTNALKKIALYYSHAGDLLSAQDVLREALKLALSIEKASDRAAAHLSLAEAYGRVDTGRVYEVMLVAVKAINAIDTPNPEDKPRSAKRDAYIKELEVLSWRLTPAFQYLVSANENEALYFADAIERREMKAAALLGIYVGLADTSPALTSENSK